jgi:hypothetical protein
LGNQKKKMKTKVKRIGSKVLGAAAMLATAGSAMAQEAAAGVPADAATDAVLDATGQATTVLIAAFAIGALFLVKRAITRGMNTVFTG